MKKMTATSWINYWETPSYIEKKEKSFNIINNYLKKNDHIPKRILDIGCGLAFETEFFQKTYNSEIFLLDDDFDNNVETQNRSIFFGPASSFKFYSNLNDLFESYKNRNLTYNFIYAKNPVIENDIVFDLIYSNRSYRFQ